MKNAHAFVGFIIAMLMLNSLALASKMCFCEIGNSPSSQKLFFKAGCNRWFQSQNNCDTKQVVPIGTSYKDLSINTLIDEVSIGYVGHWTDAWLTIDYLERIIVPLMQNKNVSVSVDNTGCESMSHPELVMSYVKNFKIPVGKTLKVRGNQTMSVGEWFGIIGPAINFTAEVSSDLASVQYPPCSKYDQQFCAQQIQRNQVGKCIDENGQLKKMACCETVIEQSLQDFQEKKAFVWMDVKKCR